MNNIIEYHATDNPIQNALHLIPPRMTLIWTGPGYYVKYIWKGETLYHRNPRNEGILFRDKPDGKDGVQVMDIDRTDHKRELQSMLKSQLIEDFRKANITVTNEMLHWAEHGVKYCWQFFPALKTEQIISLNHGDWPRCVWYSSHHTLVTIHPRLMDIINY